MAGQGQDREFSCGDYTGQSQMRNDDFMNQGSGNMHSGTGYSSQNPNMREQATGFLQQTGEQMKHMAQGAADAVKSTLGMNTDNTSSNYGSSTNYSSNPTNYSSNPSRNYSSDCSDMSNPSRMSNPSNYSSDFCDMSNPSNPSRMSNPSNMNDPSDMSDFSNMGNPRNTSNTSTRI